MIQTFLHDNLEAVKNWLDVVSIGTVVATFLSIVPHVTACLSLVWVCFRLYELDTIQKWLKKGKQNGNP